jgi:hypothetical protein
MTVTHLATPAGPTLCQSRGRWIDVSDDPARMTCKRCGGALDGWIAHAAMMEQERKRRAEVAAAVSVCGLEDVWAFLGERGQETPTDRMLLGIFESFAVGLSELGYSRR